MFIEGKSLINSILGLLWLKAFAEVEPLSPEGENESEMERCQKADVVCVRECECVREIVLCL